jgi:hypothetical protein
MSKLGLLQQVAGPSDSSEIVPQSNGGPFCELAQFDTVFSYDLGKMRSLGQPGQHRRFTKRRRLNLLDATSDSRGDDQNGGGERMKCEADGMRSRWDAEQMGWRWNRREMSWSEPFARVRGDGVGDEQLNGSRPRRQTAAKMQVSTTCYGARARKRVWERRWHSLCRLTDYIAALNLTRLVA